MSTNANFGWGSTAQEISNVDLVLIVHCTLIVSCGHMVLCVRACVSSPMHPVGEGRVHIVTVPGVCQYWKNRGSLVVPFEAPYSVCDLSYTWDTLCT